MTGGAEWLIDARGCDPARLRDLGAIRALLDKVVAELGLHVIGEPLLHPFPGAGGVTALYLLTESHLCGHTYPESGVATFNLYCCRERPPWPWAEELALALGAGAVEVRRERRGQAP